MRIQILSSVGVGSMSNVKLYSYKKLMHMRIKEFSSEWDPCRADKELMHMCVQEFSPVSGVGSMPNLKVIRGQRVLNLGIVFRCGEEACINAKVIRGKELMHTQIQEFSSVGVPSSTKILSADK